MPHKCVSRRRSCSPFFSNFSEIPCVKIGFNVNNFLRMMNESRFPECERFHFLLSSWTLLLLAGNSLFVIQKPKLLHMNTVVNIAPRGLYFHGKVIGMLVVFLGYKILILVFFRVVWKVLCRNEILVFLGLLVFHIE